MYYTVTQMGWQCPICNYVYSPTWTFCSNCNRPENEKTKTTTTITINDGNGAFPFSENSSPAKKEE